ncbi:aminomethyl-transferring glycine dehydrogenase subunit GcvPB [Fervidicoccus fontis]|uniref:glycine dehydrogenase (aminomethyl-transferring) n=1 Tax=Fervidicoccus fontis TaxID=683846 RepID=A0A2J6N467_9CREN|nr:aminomethyl-transferring glycine dehydrogenase subunit GcvPB [Fervidicoccus fontis]MBE9391700.1 aminomethyl-transferring glycine dehydrogenase subunit GcvPB [Fervidicoccus fontis]PMB76129.1 MAG: glycine dehydrogenase (aminomethyl-transferring) [Fervidicoccus fontis]PMB77656.1 MAG: glycine dehydrogenase (aminomethyl-transferring) [Fervidicoccus fontis]HEW64417.1 glycine dehydrogenase subunit 2 [Fervidicoccus fontis]
MSFRQAKWNEPIAFDIEHQNRSSLEFEVDEKLELPSELKRKELKIPGMSEIEVVRHYTRLTEESYGVDNGPVPLGSCTMKYNPRIATNYVNSEYLANIHPSLLKFETAQNILKLMYQLQEWLKEITGMDACTLQPPAGASGELTGVLIIKKYFQERGDTQRDEMLIPDSAHGSNPASSSMGGFKSVRIPSDEHGLVNLEALRASVSNKTAGLMLTNPNTLGLFEKNITEVTKILHENEAIVHYDGANLNGIIGIARPGDMGFDIVHLNLHKTFSAPHGGGGPGAGAVCVKKYLEDYLPGYIVSKDDNGRYFLKKMSKSIGDVYSTYGNLPGMIYAYIFILSYGSDIYKVAKYSTLNTNFFISLLKGVKGITLPYDEKTPRLHETVLSFKKLAEETGVTVEDVAKYLLDNGFYAPTIYFPLIVDEAFMIEFTETESYENIVKYAEVVKKAIEIAYTNPSELKQAPINTSVRRLDAVKANHPSTLKPSVKFGRK